MKVFLLLFLLHLVNKTAYGIPISAAESSATREDVGPAQQDVKRNEGEKRFKRSCSVVPFDVQCHGHCPYDEYEWNSVRSNSNCSDERVGTTYHCIDPEDESGNPIEACGVPKYCDKGKGPVISFPKGHSKTADIDCDWCPEDYFNPSESIRSDNNSKCPKVRNDCGRHGLIECDIVTGEKRHWTDSKCECDIKNNYFPLEGENKCTGQSINCVWNQPCKKSLEGFDQIHIYSMSEGKYVCQRGCKEGFEFKTSQSTECEPVQVEINGTRFDNETTIYDRSTLTPTTPEGTTTTSSPPTTTTETHEEEDAGISRGKTIGIGIAIGLVIFFGIYIVYGCYKNKERTSGKRNSRRRDQVEYKRETLVPQSGMTDLEPHDLPQPAAEGSLSSETVREPQDFTQPAAQGCSSTETVGEPQAGGVQPGDAIGFAQPGPSQGYVPPPDPSSSQPGPTTSYQPGSSSSNSLNLPGNDTSLTGAPTDTHAPPTTQQDPQNATRPAPQQASLNTDWKPSINSNFTQPTAEGSSSTETVGEPQAGGVQPGDAIGFAQPGPSQGYVPPPDPSSSQPGPTTSYQPGSSSSNSLNLPGNDTSLTGAPTDTHAPPSTQQDPQNSTRPAPQQASLNTDWKPSINSNFTQPAAQGSSSTETVGEPQAGGVQPGDAIGFAQPGPSQGYVPPQDPSSSQPGPTTSYQPGSTSSNSLNLPGNDTSLTGAPTDTHAPPSTQQDPQNATRPAPQQASLNTDLKPSINSNFTQPTAEGSSSTETVGEPQAGGVQPGDAIGFAQPGPSQGYVPPPDPSSSQPGPTTSYQPGSSSSNSLNLPGNDTSLTGAPTDTHTPPSTQQDPQNSTRPAPQQASLTTDWKPSMNSNFTQPTAEGSLSFETVGEPQDTKRNIQDSCIFDGRLILLDRKQIRTLEKSLDKKIGKGRIGTVYRSNNKEIFGITVAVKKIKTEEHANQIRREKIVSRLMNPFLLPLLAVVEKSNEECWFITPYCENGDLYDAIKRGEKEKDNKNNTEEISINNPATRVKILLHIALAIEYIHTEVPNVRGPILHKDIASKNVVLDKYLNARLADFGLAREKDDDMSTLGGRKHYDHPKVGTGCDEDYFDYYNFGVIIREMLTSLGPEGEKNLFLKKMDNDELEKRLDKNVWKDKVTRDKLKELSQNCLKEDVAWKIEDFKSNVVETLRDMFLKMNRDIFENEGESTCHQCIINPIVSTEKSSLTKAYDNCSQKIQVCMACEKNIFLNPITCYCGAELISSIGCNWGALLVAGDDECPKKAEAMKKEILKLERLITSQAPRIIGIRQHNVKMVVPSESNREKMSAWEQIQKHIGDFSEDKEIDTLLIYFSCHGERYADRNMFHLGKKEYISSDDFQKELDKLFKIDQLIIFLDRCFPPMVKFTDRKFIQINACSEKDAAVLKEKGSLFTKYVIQGLKARSEKRKCSKGCQHCVSYWKPKTKYISVFDLFDYVNKHLQLKAPEPYWQGQGVGKNIAFFTEEVVKIEFTSKGDKRCLPLKYLKHFDEVKERLFDAYGVDQRSHDVKIQKETFRQDQPYDDCDTLERVMQAWLQRLPLVVTFSAQKH